MSDLRRRLVRLAYENPSLRPDLLPLLIEKTAASGDPYWMNAKRSGKDSDGNPVRVGDRILYYPRTRAVLTGEKAERAWREFAAAADDEANYRAAGTVLQGPWGAKPPAPAVEKIEVPAGAISIGDTWEGETVRVHRYRPSIEITDLTFAGKRGKKCPRFTIYGAEYKYPPEIVEKFVAFTRAARSSGATYSGLFALALEFTSENRGDWAAGKMPREERLLPSIRVEPANSKIELRTTNLSIKASPTEAIVKDLRDTDNEPLAAPRGPKAALQFHRWLLANAAAVQKMTFRELMVALSAANIDFRDWLGMD